MKRKMLNLDAYKLDKGTCFMVRVRFGKDLSRIMSEIGKLNGCIGDDVDYNYMKKCVSEVNLQLQEKGIKAKLIPRKAVEWDKRAHYRLIARKIKG